MVFFSNKKKYHENPGKHNFKIPYDENKKKPTSIVYSQLRGNHFNETKRLRKRDEQRKKTEDKREKKKKKIYQEEKEKRQKTNKSKRRTKGKSWERNEKILEKRPSEHKQQPAGTPVEKKGKNPTS